MSDIDSSKKVYIFRANNQLLISDIGIVEKGSWEYLGNQSLLLDTKNESYLLKHGFFDENIIALKLDSTNNYAFFVNGTKYHKELNNITDIINFLENKYLKDGNNPTGLGSNKKGVLNEDGISYEIVSEKQSYYTAWGNYTVYTIKFSGGLSGIIYKGKSTGRFFYTDNDGEKMYCINFEDAAYKLFQTLK